MEHHYPPAHHADTQDGLSVGLLDEQVWLSQLCHPVAGAAQAVHLRGKVHLLARPTGPTEVRLTRTRLSEEVALPEGVRTITVTEVQRMTRQILQ